MPIYEYQCQACGHRLEKLQKLSDEPLRDCPSCTKPDLRKLVSAAAFRLKGGGWYETDFKNGSRKNVADSSSGSNDSSSSSDNASSDSGSSKDSSSDNKTSDKKSSSDVSAAAN